jgi:hypothetical protein
MIWAVFTPHIRLLTSAATVQGQGSWQFTPWQCPGNMRAGFP